MLAQTASSAFDLQYVKTIGFFNNAGAGPGFRNPYDLTVCRDGRIFVLNRRDIKVDICNLDEEYFGEFGSGPGTKDGQFMLPVSIAVDGNDRIHVTDEYTHQVSIFSLDGAFLGRWGEYGDGEGQLDGPAGIALDSQDNAYVVDQHNHRVQMFTARGEYLLGWGEYGQGDGQFDLPWGVSVDSDGDVWIADWRNDRVQKFTPDGRHVASFGESGEGDGQFRRPSDVAVDGDGYVYVADWGNERVQVLNRDGRFQMKLRGQATLSKWSDEFFASNPDEKEPRDQSRMVPPLPAHINGPCVVSSIIEPYFWGPVSVSLDKEGRLYVTESNRHRFQVYERAGRPAAIVGEPSGEWQDGRTARRPALG